MEKSIFRIYTTEEINAMNHIIGKEENNKTFTKFELETMNKIDLSDKNIVGIYKIIWSNKDNKEKSNSFLRQLEESRCCEC